MPKRKNRIKVTYADGSTRTVSAGYFRPRKPRVHAPRLPKPVVGRPHPRWPEWTLDADGFYSRTPA